MSGHALPLFVIAAGWISVAIGAWGCVREYNTREDRLMGAAFFCLLVAGAIGPGVAILFAW